MAGPQRAGTSFARGRALPIVVACGLAMGVFVGLVIVRGTGRGEENKRPPAARAGAAAAQARKSVENEGRESSGTGTGTTTSTGESKGGSSEGVRATVRKAVVTFSGVPRGAVVTVNGKRVEGSSMVELPLPGGSARVKIEVKAKGYKPWSETRTVTSDQRVTVELKKKKASSSGPSGPGGLIDLR